MKQLSRITVVAAAATVGLLAGSGTAAAAPSCVGGSLTYQGANAYVQDVLGLKNLGESFARQARGVGIGKEQSTATRLLIADCR